MLQENSIFHGKITLVSGFDFPLRKFNPVKVPDRPEAMTFLFGYQRKWTWVCLKMLGIFPNEIAIFNDGIMISKTIGYNGVHTIFRQTHLIG